MTQSTRPLQTWQVFVEDFAKREADRHAIGEFPSYEAALSVATQRVDQVLAEFQKPEQSAKALFELWTLFGEDVFIVPAHSHNPFSALDYARLRCVQMTCDESRPVWLEVTCIDRLNTSSGAPSGEGKWVFWVNAPATCAGATNVIRRAVEAKYDALSDEAFAGDGSTYTLLECNMRELSADEIAGAPWKQYGKTAFTLQADGRLGAFDAT